MSSEPYLIVLTGDGATSYFVDGLAGIKRAYFVDVMGEPEEATSNDLRMLTETYARIDDIDEWTLAHDKTRLSYHESFEDGSFSAYRILDWQAALASRAPVVDEDKAVEVMMSAADKAAARATPIYQACPNINDQLNPVPGEECPDHCHFCQGKNKVIWEYEEGKSLLEIRMKAALSALRQLEAGRG